MEREDLADVRKMMGFGPDSVVSLVSTEGDTDPSGYYDVVHNGKYPSIVKQAL
jgi:diaminopropionate ammonia-lyase